MKLLHALFLTIILLVAVLTFCRPARAADVLFDFGAVELLLPLSQVDGVYVYDMLEERADKASRWGLETPLTRFYLPVSRFRRLPVTVTFGATTDTIRKGDLIGGLHTPVASFFEESVNVGLASGYRFTDSEWIFGLKASRNFFGKN